MTAPNDKEALVLVLLRLLNVAVELNQEVLSLQSALSELIFGDAEAAKKRLLESLGSPRVNDAMQEALEALATASSNPNV